MARPCKVPARVILRAAEYYTAIGSHAGRRIRTTRGQPCANEIGLIDLLADELKISKPVIHRVLRRSPRSGAPLPAKPIGFEGGISTATPAPTVAAGADTADLARVGLRAAEPTPMPPRSSAPAVRRHLEEALDWALAEGGFPADFTASAEALQARLRALP